MGSLDNPSSTFNSGRFLYSIAAHTRVVISVLKIDRDNRIHRKSSFQTPNNQLVPSKTLSHSRSEQQLQPLTRSELEQYSLTSAASPNAGSSQVGPTRRRKPGCCYLCNVNDSQYQKQVIGESRPIHSAPLPESRRIHAVPLPESHCIESHSRPVTIPKSRICVLPESTSPKSPTEDLCNTAEPEPTRPSSRHSVSRSASLRKALAELDTNIIPTYSTTPISPPRRIKVKPLSLSFTPSSGSAPRPSPSPEHNRRVSYAGQSFFFEDEQPSPSPRTRRFPPKTPPQPFLLSPAMELSPRRYTQPPIPPLRRSSLLFRHCYSPSNPPTKTLILTLRLPSPPIGPPSRALPPAHLSSLSLVEKQHYRLLISLTAPSTSYRDPLFTTLLQVATTELCMRNLCLLVGKVYTEQEELRRWLDPVARNIDCARAVEVLTKWLKIGGEEMEGMVGWLAGRLTRGNVGGVGVLGEMGCLGVGGTKGMSGMVVGRGRGRGRGRCSVM